MKVNVVKVMAVYNIVHVHHSQFYMYTQEEWFGKELRNNTRCQLHSHLHERKSLQYAGGISIS